MDRDTQKLKDARATGRDQNLAALMRSARRSRDRSKYSRKIKHPKGDRS